MSWRRLYFSGKNKPLCDKQAAQPHTFYFDFMTISHYTCHGSIYGHLPQIQITILIFSADVINSVVARDVPWMKSRSQEAQENAQTDMLRDFSVRKYCFPLKLL
jgi:hypothetical protein